MLTKLIILFTAIPLIELFILIKAGSIIGAPITILIVLVTGVAGASLARQQGFKIIQKIQTTMAKGAMPGNEMVQGVLVFAGGLMLLTPGFITDILGFSLLIPFSRQHYAFWLIRFFSHRVKASEFSNINTDKSLGGGEVFDHDDFKKN